MIDPVRRSPSPQTLKWVRAQVGRPSTVVRVRRLMGGISSSVHAITLRDAKFPIRTLGLRRWVGDWLDHDPSAAGRLLASEQSALEGAERAGVAAPPVHSGRHVGRARRRTGVGVDVACIWPDPLGAGRSGNVAAPAGRDGPDDPRHRCRRPPLALHTQAVSQLGETMLDMVLDGGWAHDEQPGDGPVR